MRSIFRDLRDMAAYLATRWVFWLQGVVPGYPGNLLKTRFQRWLLSIVDIEIGSGSQISPGFFVFRRGNFRSGVNCRFGYDFMVWNHSEFLIGDDLLASHGVKIICGTHEKDLVRSSIAGPISIGNNVWIGANVLIVGPCTIGDNTIIGANSFVCGEFPAGSVIGGSPARIIRNSVTRPVDE